MNVQEWCVKWSHSNLSLVANTMFSLNKEHSSSLGSISMTSVFLQSKRLAQTNSLEMGYWFLCVYYSFITQKFGDACMSQRTMSSSVHITVWRQFNAKPLPKPVLTYCKFDPKEYTAVQFESHWKYVSFRKCICVMFILWQAVTLVCSNRWVLGSVLFCMLDLSI